MEKKLVKYKLVSFFYKEKYNPMDKISEEMKTEKDFIEKMEASSVPKEAIPTKSEADIERENLQMEMMIKSKEESKDVVSEEKEDYPRVTIDELQASPVTSEALHNLSKDAKITNAEPEIKHVTLEITAKRPVDDAPWAEEETPIQEETAATWCLRWKVAWSRR